MDYEAYHNRRDQSERSPQRHLFPDEDWVRLALDGVPCAHSQIMDRANHIIEAHEEATPAKCENYGAEESTNEAFHSLLRRQFDERRAPKGYAPNISKDIVANDKRRRNPEPD